MRDALTKLQTTASTNHATDRASTFKGLQTDSQVYLNNWLFIFNVKGKSMAVFQSKLKPFYDRLLPSGNINQTYKVTFVRVESRDLCHSSWHRTIEFRTEPSYRCFRSYWWRYQYLAYRHRFVWRKLISLHADAVLVLRALAVSRQDRNCVVASK